LNISRLHHLTVTACAGDCKGVSWSQVPKGTSPSSFLRPLGGTLRAACRPVGSRHAFGTAEVRSKGSGRRNVLTGWPRAPAQSVTTAPLKNKGMYYWGTPPDPCQMECPLDSLLDLRIRVAGSIRSRWVGADAPTYPKCSNRLAENYGKLALVPPDCVFLV